MSLQQSNSNLASQHQTPQTISPLPNPVQARSHSPFAYNPRGTLSRQSSLADRSQGNSNTGSPALRPASGHGPYDSHEYLPGPAVHTRDESVFYQAETQMLTRENQMLKLRIRELGTKDLWRFSIFSMLIFEQRNNCQSLTLQALLQLRTPPSPHRICMSASQPSAADTLRHLQMRPMHLLQRRPKLHHQTQGPDVFVFVLLVLSIWLRR